MKVRNVVLAILLGIAVIALSLLVTAATAVGQTKTQEPAPPIATAQIPFDFWMGDTHLPAGEYALYPVLRLTTLVLLRNTKTNAQEQAFQVPTGELVRAATTSSFLSCRRASIICGSFGNRTAKRF